ncbi:Spo0E family sporulation regulatory protein-aspartic acid phosphatase [Paenibacillus sp. SYP-B3998]|uniref:Spo0E family sporulation regulatory protein-aspartic acid phosphatase n=1 Tax=Paenibacillus sp. SYP-B3998 TaxID=2678564 RepID=A0A6G3ZUH3_9BACL|nr:Spo0E family sporulation regulatory protein-aspartic acid phosphatase [Paenibacillus sp. SYP-B3998]
MKLSEIETEIESLRKQLVDAYLLSGSINTNEVLEKSRLLDHWLNRYEQSMNKK